VLGEKITAVIVDDEPHARQGLQNALAKFEELEVIGVCENGLQAVKAVHELNPQLLFLDIQMPKLDGFDVLELLGEQAPYVIFVTAFDEYAVKAFESNAVDYLMKPLDPERLQQAVQKIVARVNSSEPVAIKALLSERERGQENLQRILVRDGRDVHVLAVKLCVLYRGGRRLCSDSDRRGYPHQTGSTEQSRGKTRFEAILSHPSLLSAKHQLSGENRDRDERQQDCYSHQW